MRTVRNHRFNGVNYKIITDEIIEGLCDPPNSTKPLIRICAESAPLRTKEGLIAVLHESLHASNWNKKEEIVGRTASEIGNLLWRLGYRLKKKR